MRWSVRGVMRYPVLGSLLVLAAVLSLYYFVSTGGTYDPVGGVGNVHHRFHANSVHRRGSDSSSEANDPDTDTDTAHHFRRLDEKEIHKNDDKSDHQDDEDMTDVVGRAKARIKKHCNPPDKRVTGAEGEVPDGYKLEMVHVLIRHGDRSPMNSIPAYKTAKISCELDTNGLVHPRIKEFAYKMSQSKTKGKSSAAKRLGLYPNHKFCEGAQLTGIGTVQHILNGEFLHKVYSQKWDLIGESGWKVLVKSTDYSRTYQSAVALLFGLLPKLDISKMKINIIPNTQLCSRQYLEGRNCKCSATRKFQKIVQTEYMKRSQNSSLHANIRQEMSSLLSIRSSRLPWIAAIVDVVLGHVCHYDVLPCFSQSGKCLSWRLIGKMWEFLDFNGREQNENSEANEKLQRLSMHPLMLETARRLVNVTHGIAANRFVLYSAHDTTVMPLAVALGIHDGIWPQYATRLVIEMYSKETGTDSQEYFIRVLFNGQDRTKLLRFCKDDLNRDYLCPLQRFVDFVNSQNMRYFNAKNYAEACSR